MQQVAQEPKTVWDLGLSKVFLGGGGGGWGLRTWAFEVLGGLL